MKILLLSVVPPSPDITGGILLEQVIRQITSDQLCCFICRPVQGGAKIAQDLAHLKVKTVIRPPDRFIRLVPGVLGGQIGRLGEWLKRLWIEHFMYPKALKFARQQKVECIWATLSGKTEMIIAPKLATTLKVPLLTQVWDHPDWIQQAAQLDAKRYQAVLQLYEAALKQSACCATASWNMAAEYAERFAIPTVVFVNALPAAVALPPQSTLHAGDELKIAVAGQIYALDEWQAFLQALQSVQWQIAGRRVSLHLFGRFPEADHVTTHGYLPQPELIATLAEQADILYGSYWLDPHYQTVAQTSFPGKLVTYCAAGRPIFFHGPVDSQPGALLTAAKAGVCCASLESAKIIAALTTLVEDPALYSTITSNARRLFDTNLTTEKQASDLTTFLSYGHRP